MTKTKGLKDLNLQIISVEFYVPAVEVADFKKEIEEYFWSKQSHHAVFMRHSCDATLERLEKHNEKS